MISQELIESRINNFWGYGNLESDLWFMSMEEGTNGSIEELKNRFIKTKGKNVLDCKFDMLDIPEHIKYYAGKNPPLQPTMSKIIRVLLNIISNQTIDKEDVRQFQKHSFGRLNANHCSLEFMPLPVPKSDAWIYGSLNIDYLSNRESYNKTVMPKRIALFNQLIEEYKPKAIIFYSLEYFKYWERISCIGFNEIAKNIWHTKGLLTNYFIIPHPQMRGMRNDDWDRYGKLIKNIIY